MNEENYSVHVWTCIPNTSSSLHRPNFTHVILDPFAFVNLKSGVGSVRTECSGRRGQREMLLSLVTSNYGSIR